MNELELKSLKEEQGVAARGLLESSSSNDVAAINHQRGFYQGLLHAEKVLLDATRKARQRDED